MPAALVATRFAYGVDPDTGDRWTLVTLARPDGPRWICAFLTRNGKGMEGKGIPLEIPLLSIPLPPYVSSTSTTPKHPQPPILLLFPIQKSKINNHQSHH